MINYTVKAELNVMSISTIYRSNQVTSYYDNDSFRILFDNFG